MRLIIKIFLSSVLFLSFCVCTAQAQAPKHAPKQAPKIIARVEQIDRDIPVLNPRTTVIRHGEADDFWIVSDTQAKEIKENDVKKAKQEQEELQKINEKARTTRLEEIYTTECAIESAENVGSKPIKCDEDNAKVAKAMPASKFINTPELSKPIVPASTIRGKKSLGKEVITARGKNFTMKCQIVKRYVWQMTPKKQKALVASNNKSTKAEAIRQVITYHITEDNALERIS